MDSWILWSIPSVLLQRLPVHREQQIPLLPPSRFPGRALKCPQHSLNCKSCGQKPNTPGRQEVGPFPKLFFHAGGLKSHKNLDGRLASLFMDEAGRCRDAQRAPVGTVGIPTLCSFSHQAPLEPFPCLPMEFFHS